MLKATALIAGTLLLGTASYAVAESPQQLAQSQMQNRSQIDQEYQDRLRAAKTPEERARIQAEYDRHMQEGAVPNSGSGVRTAPGTSGSGTMPSRPGAGSQPGESPSGGGAVPRGQGGSGGSE
jgi:hypothetical protein